MSDRDDVLRELASVRRKLDDLQDEMEAAEGAMPSGQSPGAPPKRSLEMALKRIDRVEELASDVADRLRSAIGDMEE